MSNKYIPINFSFSRRKCLIVGGGEVALRKIENLHDYDCDITVIAPEPVEKIEYFASKKKVKLEKREYKSPEVRKYGIAIAACDDLSVNKMVHDDCVANNIPVNVVDNPELCDFTFPAVLKRGKLSVAVSTDGQAPFLAAQLRVILENIFPVRWKRIADYAGDFRKDVTKRWENDSQMKAECFNNFLQADWKTILKEKSENEIQAELEKMLDGETTTENNSEKG